MPVTASEDNDMRHKGKKLVAILTAVSLLMPGTSVLADEVLENGYETE